MTSYYNDIDPYCCKVLRKNIALGNLPGGHVDERDIRDVQVTDIINHSHVHLFAGVGCFALGMGWARYPESLRTMTLGFPCQDLSVAGRQAGLEGERSGLWKQAVRLIEKSYEAKSRFDFIIIENVRNLLSGGDDDTICTPGTGDMDDDAAEDVFRSWMGTVLADLAACGLDAEWTCLRASDFGAPHIRERVFIVAYPQYSTSKQRHQSNVQRGWQTETEQVGMGSSHVAYPTSQGLPFRGYPGLTASETQARTGMEPELERCSQGVGLADTYSQGLSVRNGSTATRGTCTTIDRYRTGDAQSRICRVFDGTAPRLDGYQWPARPGYEQHSWEPPRVVTGKQTHRVARLKALGNAVVPQCVEYVARCILQAVQAERVA